MTDVKAKKKIKNNKADLIFYGILMAWPTLQFVVFYIGVNFTGNYNLTILDVGKVYIGDNVMIGPGTLISTVNHPMSPMGRRRHLGIVKPVHIGNDVWIGGNVTILPGITIGNNVVVAAGAVVTKDVPDNSLVGGVPARIIRTLENALEEHM